MQPINSRTLIEEVNDSDLPLEPLHHPVSAPTAGELAVATTSSGGVHNPVSAPPGGEVAAAIGSSGGAQICAASAVAQTGSGDRPDGSENSIDQINPKTPAWTRRVRIGAAAPGRAPCADRMTALEKSVRMFAEAPGENVIVPKLGVSFDTLGEAYDFYNLYSWEKGFGIRYGKSRLNVNRTKCM